MFEVIRDALIWIMGWVLDRRPHGGEAFRLLFLIAFSVLATWIALYWRDLAYRSSAIRRRLMPDERYAGRYLQALWRQGEIRYSFVHIFYDWRRRRFEVAGRTYNPKGEELGTFQSTYVRFPSEKDANIEFIWRAGDNATGYTRMNFWKTSTRTIFRATAPSSPSMDGRNPIPSASSICTIITCAKRLACVPLRVPPRSRNSSGSFTPCMATG